MKKTFIGLIAIVVIALLSIVAQYFYPKSSVPEIEIPNEVIREELSGNEQLLNLSRNEMEDDIVYFGKYDGMLTEYLLANKKQGIVYGSFIPEAKQQLFDTGDSTIDGFTMLYPLFNHYYGYAVIKDNMYETHDNFGVFNPCKVQIDDPRSDSSAPTYKTSCDFVYIWYTSAPIIFDGENKSSRRLTTIKRYNIHSGILETVGSLDIFFGIDDIQSEYLIGTEYPCIGCDANGPYNTIVFNTLTKKYINLGPTASVELGKRIEDKVAGYRYTEILYEPYNVIYKECAEDEDWMECPYSEYIPSGIQKTRADFE